jgi:hypothetical protein
VETPALAAPRGLRATADAADATGYKEGTRHVVRRAARCRLLARVLDAPNPIASASALAT